MSKLEQLRRLLTSPPDRTETLGPWADEWLQKRLVRALQRLEVTTAPPNLRRLQAHVGERPAPPSPVPKARRAR